MPDYLDAPEDVEELARARFLQNPLMDACKAKIKYLVKSAKKSTWLGQTHLAHGPWKHLSDFDYVIILWAEWWECASDHDKQALLYHELLHIALTQNETWALRKHTIQEFPEVVKQFGAWTPELKCLEPIVRRPY